MVWFGTGASYETLKADQSYYVTATMTTRSETNLLTNRSWVLLPPPLHLLSLTHTFSISHTQCLSLSLSLSLTHTHTHTHTERERLERSQTVRSVVPMRGQAYNTDLFLYSSPVAHVQLHVFSQGEVM